MIGILNRCVFILLALLAASQTCVADTITTTFAGGNGQAGNMFDIDVLAPTGINMTALELNLDIGTWDIELYTRDGSYLGNETNSAVWTLQDSIVGLVSSAANAPTTWNIADQYVAPGTEALYVTVTNGTSMNYTNGTTEGAVAASNSDLEIFEGTGNVATFGGQFRPRVWNGSIIYDVLAIPEPGSLMLMSLMVVLWSSCRRRACTVWSTQSRWSEIVTATLMGHIYC